MAVYGPIVASKEGFKGLVLWRQWDSDAVQAEAMRMEDRQGVEGVIRFPGGLARHKAMTVDAFATVVCHEIGHHVGGAPSLWGRSIEGQADYFASLKCLRRTFAQDDNIAIMAERTVHPTPAALCAEAFGSPAEVALCERIAMAGKQSSVFLAEKRGVAHPDFDTPDPTIVDRHYIRGTPAPQCRLDTYLAGAICQEGLYEDLNPKDAAPGTCTRAEGRTVGARPRCWFAPPKSESHTRSTSTSSVIDLRGKALNRPFDPEQPVHQFRAVRNLPR